MYALSAACAPLRDRHRPGAAADRRRARRRRTCPTRSSCAAGRPASPTTRATSTRRSSGCARPSTSSTRTRTRVAPAILHSRLGYTLWAADRNDEAADEHRTAVRLVPPRPPTAAAGAGPRRARRVAHGHGPLRRVAHDLRGGGGLRGGRGRAGRGGPCALEPRVGPRFAGRDRRRHRASSSGPARSAERRPDRHAAAGQREPRLPAHRRGPVRRRGGGGAGRCGRGADRMAWSGGSARISGRRRSTR